MIQDLLDALSNFVGNNGNVLAFVVVALAIIGLWLQFLGERRDTRKEMREKDTLGIQRRRLAEVNVRVRHELVVTQPGVNESGFVVSRIPLANSGDGPVDILAALISARALSSQTTPGVGLRSRDVLWEDYARFFWEHSDGDAPFLGISTTKSMVASPDHFIRLASKEHGMLQRLDAINNPDALRQSNGMTMMYRLFLAVRGYPLGEILRQLGGTPPDPLQNVQQERLQFETLAQPNYLRWRAVQEALLNLNRLAFRFATGSPDPLGELADPDAWRYFLLHHREFIGADAVTQRSEALRPETILEVTQEVQQRFFALLDGRAGWRLPRELRLDSSDATITEARAYCRARLDPMVKAWARLLTIIEEGKAYPRDGFPSSVEKDRERPKGCPDEAYPVRIHTDPMHRALWLDLLREGYLISRPLIKSGRKDYDLNDIPPDPRLLEPYVTRLHFFLTPVSLRQGATVRVQRFAEDEG